MKKPELIIIAGCNASGKSTFIRTRLNELSRLEIIIMHFKKGNLSFYNKNSLQYPQKFAQLSFSKGRLHEDAYKIIIANQNYSGFP